MEGWRRKEEHRPCSFRDLENSLFSPRQLRVAIFWNTLYHWKSFYAGYSLLTDTWLLKMGIDNVNFHYLHCAETPVLWLDKREINFIRSGFVPPKEMNSGNLRAKRCKKKEKDHPATRDIFNKFKSNLPNLDSRTSWSNKLIWICSLAL